MGIFGSKKTYVSSTLYNLAGEEKERPDYLKSTVIGSVLANNPSIAETIERSYLAGPGIQFRNFHNWAEDNYDYIGIPEANLIVAPEVDNAVLVNAIPHDTDEFVFIQHVAVNLADFAYWAEQYMMENYADDLNTAWTSDIDEATNQITITFEDTSTVTFAPSNFDRSARYIYANYVLSREEFDPIELDDVTEWDGPFMFIYRIGSGNPALDALVLNTALDGEDYLPFIPLRLDNEFVSESFEPVAYDLAKKAYKKAIGGKVDKVIDSINESESLEDIDYAYIAFGVSLNVRDNSSKRYMYEFFLRLMASQGTTSTTQALWETRYYEYKAQQETWKEWWDAQSDPMDPLYETDPPPQPVSFGSAPKSAIRVRANGTIETNFDMEVEWSFILEETGSGLGKPDAAKGELWFEELTAFNESNQIYGSRGFYDIDNTKLDRFYLWWQVDDDNWKRLELVGFLHKNYVYNGKFVEISMKEALDDGEESGFLLPIHMPTYRAMGLVHSTQVGTACTFLVLNSYQIKKTGFLGSTFFKVFLVAVIIAVVVVAPQLAPGVAKAAAATGSALGLSGTTALVVGAAVNAIAAMIISNLVLKGSVAVFGDRLGTIIGTLVIIASGNIAMNLADTGQIALNFGNMMTAQNLTMLATTIGDVYSKFVYFDAMDLAQKNEELLEDYNSEMKNISDLYAENIGYGSGVIDPMMFTEFSDPIGEALSPTEMPDAFLARTLMTGSDIAELSMEMLANFSKLTLNTDLPLMDVQ